MAIARRTEAMESDGRIGSRGDQIRAEGPIVAGKEAVDRAVTREHLMNICRRPMRRLISVGYEQLPDLAPIDRCSTIDPHPADREPHQLRACRKLEPGGAVIAADRLNRRPEAYQVAERTGKNNQRGPFGRLGIV